MLGNLSPPLGHASRAHAYWSHDGAGHALNILGAIALAAWWGERQTWIIDPAKIDPVGGGWNFVVSQTTPVDPSRAPPGQHVVRIHVRVVPGTLVGDAAGLIDDRDWEATKGRFAERLIDLLADHAPNVREAILARHIVSPMTSSATTRT